MATSDGNAASSGSSNTFDDFISQFNARVQIQQQLQYLRTHHTTNNSNDHHHQQQGQPATFQYYGFTSNLTPTAAEFVPRKYQTEANDGNSGGGGGGSGGAPPQTMVSMSTTMPAGSARPAVVADNEDDYDGDDRENIYRAGSSNHYGGGGVSGGTGGGAGGSRSSGGGRPRRNESLKPRNGWHTRDDRPVGRQGKWKANQQTAGSGRFRPHDDDYAAGDVPPRNGETSSRRNGQRQWGNRMIQPDPDERRTNGQSKGAGAAPQTESPSATPLSKCSQREKLMREIECYRLECLVCCEIVKPMQSTWSCGNCYHILHLGCVTKWATSSQSEDGSGWRCPACQHVSKKVPREYFCFCGKQKNPAYNREDLAHSCGEVCGRRDVCEHACTLLCHPGPCPPCQASVQRRCGCGRLEKTVQCCQKEELLCEAVCEKPLNCELHRCGRRCHAGSCDTCTEQVQHSCHCGKGERSVVCSVENLAFQRYGCGKACERPLGCGNHRCARLCHEGECEACADAPERVRSCPCGREPIVPGSRQSCLDPIPTCSGPCGRKLACGPPGANHCCEAACHRGACPPCKKSTTVKCRCGSMDQPMRCKELTTRADDARCKKRCVRRRSCAKHKCNQVCCIDLDHICPKTCSLPLSCGRHRCDKPCHKGNCRPCHRVSFDELACDCGANVIYPPVPCGTRKPACDRPCGRRHACDHPALHNCHAEAECPPCVVLTTKHCHGRHEQRKTIPCYQESFSCGMPCAKPLACGRHKCIRACHEDECAQEGTAGVCKQSCTRTREACPHPCNAPCHEGECPDVPCKIVVEVTCECGNRKQQRTCHDFSKEYRRIATAQLASSVQEMQRGGSVELSDILGPVRPKNNKTLECNEECRMLERNRRLAIALQIRNPDLPSKLQPNYSETLRAYAKKDPALVQMIHDKLTELVKLAKESKQKSRSYSFPVMNREKRAIVHEMCHMFGVESVAYDAEPNRNVVATADRFTSWLPSMSLMEVLQRENGQRRIVVPSLNAWGKTTLTGAAASSSSK
ncbi:protein shuttle craft [Anopheles merus]|uniref:Transcriptional repressor NF-X1 n=1 Tax=Anopheles merus TaxID=30066 RepID=A0A182V2P2_ANOME|nr:protein shuttle craft [Anopheles merus]XP_041776976.1 protein shuttle craft [Anopheles merus]XP_041776977.1 protein shuttle craft [Anopheles merus]XP_041776978.1 protein shuttle craft [Anopheles merus]XP_041776980.1 protein shuttle craft [Anopheles merus]